MRKRAVVRAKIELGNIGAVSMQRMGASAMSVRKINRDALTTHAPGS